MSYGWNISVEMCHVGGGHGVPPPIGVLAQTHLHILWWLCLGSAQKPPLPAPLVGVQGEHHVQGARPHPQGLPPPWYPMAIVLKEISRLREDTR